MTNTLLRGGALACALLASTALTAPAFGQTNQSVQPAFRSVDDNGVDLLSGTYAITLVEGTIGSGDTGLSVVRTGTSAYGTATWQNIYISQTVSGSVRTADVVLGDRTERFTSTGGGAFVGAQGNGATLSGGLNADFTYTDAGGTVTVFGAPADDQFGASNLCSHAAANPNGCFALATSITRPDAAVTTLGWDVHANCATVYNPDGSLDCQYGWRLAGVANSFGYALDFAYVSNSVSFHANPSGDWFKRAGATLSNGAATSSIGYAYVSPTVTEITDTGGRVWRLTIGTNSLGIRRPGSSSDDIAVTFSGGIVTQVVRDGIATTYSRSVSGSNATTTITDAASHATMVVADLSRGRITSVTDPLSHTISYTYDGDSRLTRVTAPEGNYVGYTYDSRGNVTETRAVAKSGSGLSDIVTGASYDSTCSNVVTCNQPNSVTDARGNVTDYTYDGTHGGVLTVTSPAPSGSGVRPQTRYAYALSDGEYRLTGISACAAGSTASPTCVGTADETRSVIGYDASGNATSVEQRDGTGSLTATTAMTWDGYGDLLIVDGPLSGSADTTRYRYNAARQIVGVIGPDPDGAGALHNRAIRTSYGSDGLPTSVEQGNVNSQSDSDWAAFSALQAVQTEYDAHHRPVVQRLVSGSTTYALTQTSYDSVGRANCAAQRMNPGEFATASLPSDACTLDTQGSYGPDRIVRTSFDNAGRPNLVQTGYGVSGVQADEVATTYTDNGRLATATDAEANRTTYEYDGHDRLVKTRMPDPGTHNSSSTTDYEQLGYDAAGNVTSRRLRDAQTISFTYDDLNRLFYRDIPTPVTGEGDVVYYYDNFDRPTLTADSLSPYNYIIRAYDALNRVTLETTNTGQRGLIADEAGRLIRIDWDGGPDIAYDRLVTGEVATMRENPAGTNTTLATFAYDDLGRRTSLTRGNGTSTSYAYDNASRLTQLGQNLNGSTNDVTFDYSYNPAGEIVSNTRSNDAYSYTGHANVNRADSVNGLNPVTAPGGTSVSHDARGNIGAIGAASYGYTTTNQLRTGGTATLAYGPEGDLLAEVGAATTRFDSLLGHIITERDGSGNRLRRFVPGPDGDEPMVWYEGSGTSTRRYFHEDERGSVIAVSDASGNLVGSINRYDEYGVPQGALTGRFGYTGQAWISEAALYHYRNRAYNPAMGRFMQTDPIGFDGGMNVYAYVRNNPVNLRDPTGLICQIHVWGLVKTTDWGPVKQGERVVLNTWTEKEGCDADLMSSQAIFGDLGGGGLFHELDHIAGNTADGGQQVFVDGRRLPDPNDFEPLTAEDLYQPTALMRPSTQCSAWGDCRPHPTNRIERGMRCRAGRRMVRVGAALAGVGSVTSGARGVAGRVAVTIVSRVSAAGTLLGGIIALIGLSQTSFCDGERND